MSSGFEQTKFNQQLSKNYLVAVLANRIQAEAAYLQMEKETLPMEDVSILGKGYKSADEFGLINPDVEADKQSTQLSYWVIPFGFLAGLGFSILTGLQTFAWAGEVGNHLIGGVLGGAAGLMGSYATGRLVGWTVSSGDAIAYRNRLNAGKYLIIVRGSKDVVDAAARILYQYDPENIQGYVEQI